ncbi:MAG TPA: glycosyltransferase family 2 protein [Edaphocola sp.]|nr:glycosyltransferase family 2 protein [Edaphocola sp.]
MIVCEHLTAVVILSYKSIEWHKLFLPKIIEQSASGYDVVVVDHASPDDTSLYIKEHFPTVKLLRLEKNLGFAGGYAAALKQIKAKYFILLSSDFEVTDNWYPPLETLLENNPQIAAAQPKIRYWKQRELFEYAGAAGGFMDKWGYMFCRGRIFSTLEEDQGQYNDTVEIFWASGGCLMVRSEAYFKTGGLDPDLYAHMEEIDLCWQLQNLGYKIAATGASTVYHVGGSIISYGSPQKTFYNYRNNLAIILKNEKWSKILWLIPLRLVLDGVSCILFLKEGNIKNILAVLKAHFDFYKTFGLWKSKRSKHKGSPTETPLKSVYSKSIIIDYFIKGKKKFNDLDFPISNVN